MLLNLYFYITLGTLFIWTMKIIKNSTDFEFISNVFIVSDDGIDIDKNKFCLSIDILSIKKQYTTFSFEILSPKILVTFSKIHFNC